MFLSYFLLSTNQNSRSGFARSLAKVAGAEGSIEERLSESLQEVPVICDSGSFSLDTRSLRFFCRR